jgi:hypothetical protein
MPGVRCPWGPVGRGRSWQRLRSRLVDIGAIVGGTLGAGRAWTNGRRPGHAGDFASIASR